MDSPSRNQSVASVLNRVDNAKQTPPWRRRVLFVLEYFHPHVGGVETLFLHLAEALAARGIQVTVATMRLPGTPAEEVVKGVRIVRLRTPSWASRYWFMMLAMPTVQRLAREHDLIHTTTYNAAFPAWIASWRTGKPAVITVHEVFGDQWNHLPRLNSWLGYGYRSYEHRVLKLGFQHYICDSEFTRNRLHHFTRIPASKTSVVYPALDYNFWERSKHVAIDLRHQLQLPHDAFVYLFFGRPGISKGVEDLVEAAASVRTALPSARLVLLLGRHPADGNQLIRKMVKDRQLEDHVVICDPVSRDQLPGHLMGADCVVVPSISEGFGYSAAEAATLGCTVVATSGHSVEEILGESMISVPPRSPAALADAILRVARETPALAAPRRTFTVEKHIEGVLRVYQQVVPAVPSKQAA